MDWKAVLTGLVAVLFIVGSVAIIFYGVPEGTTPTTMGVN